MGAVFKRGQTIQTWVKYQAVLSNGYIYFFLPQQQFYDSFVYIRNSEVINVDKETAGYANAIFIKNRYNECYLAFDKEANLKKWTEAILSNRNQYNDLSLDDIGETTSSVK